jgi:hypothetical protein
MLASSKACLLTHLTIGALEEWRWEVPFLLPSADRYRDLYIIDSYGAEWRF